MTHLISGEHIRFTSGKFRNLIVPVGVIDGTYKKYADMGCLLPEDDSSIISLDLLRRVGVQFETVYPDDNGVVMNEEMRKFRALLDAEHIEWNDLSDNGAYPMCRTHFEYNGQRWSVVHGYGSYGGYNAFTGADEGLLEVYNFVEEPKGFLTAEEVMQYVKGAE